VFLYIVTFISIDTAVQISVLFVCLIILAIDSVQLINTTKIKNKTYGLNFPFYIVLFSVLDQPGT